MSKSTFTTDKSKTRIKQIIVIASGKPVDIETMAKATYTTAKCVGYVVGHMVNSGLLVKCGKRGNSLLYQSTGKGIQEGGERDIIEVRKSAHVKPFYDALALPKEFFQQGCATSQQQA